ncbi:hypothetical protein An04g09970 [Aspergillus niger]|uniref:Uncharacterized protein n=2 Tax=Aspergillus niger TaxID=5061 RepID=A2QKB0_ASPNC|nr:hypothetical protein An04g09970 [Aspergillus niger]CAK39056.1 hypothetical protein An04g09970 [Aspergillus niger]
MEPVVSMMRFELYRQSIAGRATLRDADCHHGVSLTSASPQCSNLFTIEGNGMRHQAGEQMVGTKGSNKVRRDVAGCYSGGDHDERVFILSPKFQHKGLYIQQ